MGKELKGVEDRRIGCGLHVVKREEGQLGNGGGWGDWRMRWSACSGMEMRGRVILEGEYYRSRIWLGGQGRKRGKGSFSRFWISCKAGSGLTLRTMAQAYTRKSSPHISPVLGIDVPTSDRRTEIDAHKTKQNERTCKTS